MVRSLGPGAKPRQRLQRAVRETVKETARVAAVRALHIPPEVRTDEHLDKISRALSQSTFFATLDAGVTREVCRYLGLITAEHGQTLCRQGEVGDCMYFIMEGRVNVMVRRKGKDEDSKVDSMSEGACFGQLALVNADGDSDENHRRSATCRASGPCVLAVLLRDDYRRLVAQAVRDLHDKLVAALRTIPPLSAAPRAELQKAAVMMRTRPITYAKGEFIAEETTPAEKLVFLSEGTVVVKSQGKIVRQMVVNSMEMVGAHCLLHDEVFANSIITGSVVSGYTLPPHLARKLLSTRSVTAAVEAKHREEQALYSERVEKSTETAQLRSSLIVGRALQAAKKHEKALHPAVRSGRRHLFPDGKLNHLKVPDYRSPKSFEDNTACVHQVQAEIAKRMRAAKVNPQREYLPLHSPRNNSNAGQLQHFVKEQHPQQLQMPSPGRSSSRPSSSIKSAFGRTMQVDCISPELPERPAVLPSLIEKGRPWTPLPPLPPASPGAKQCRSSSNPAGVLCSGSESGGVDS